MTTLPETLPADSTDVELARRAGRGDEAAFRSLYERHAAPLVVYLRARTAGQVDEIHQDAWRRVWNHLPDFDGASFRAWAFRVAQSSADDPFAEHRHDVARCLEGLTRAEVQVVRARLEGIESARIAERGKVPVERVNSLFLQARARLADCPGPAGPAAPLVLDLPDEPAEMGPWLDCQLVGLGLGLVVAELEAVHGGRGGDPSRTLDEVLSEHLPAVLETGLSALPRLVFRDLLRQPRLLLDLQERVLKEGGPYWSRLEARDAEAALAVETGWAGVRSNLPALEAAPDEDEYLVAVEPEPSLEFTPVPPAVPAVVTGPVPAPVTVPAPAPAAAPPPVRPPRVWLLRFWARSATVLASAAIFLYVAEHFDAISQHVAEHFHPHPPAPRRLPANVFAQVPEWGWNRPDLLLGSENASSYLNILARSLNEWYDRRPFTPDELAVRLGELRSGFTRLIVAGPGPLSPANREWLVKRARKCAGKLDEAIDALERGESVEVVRPQVDAIVNDLFDQLDKRARSA